MTHRHQLTDLGAIKRFVLGGNARFTLVSKLTGNRFTYRARRPDPAKPVFVSVLTGADNEGSYTFLGTIFDDGSYRRGSRSSIAWDAKSANAWQWFFDHVADNDQEVLNLSIEFWHEGRCARCGRALTVPQSIATGFGPECASIIGIDMVEVETDRQFAEVERKQEERGFLSDPDFQTYLQLHTQGGA